MGYKDGASGAESLVDETFIAKKIVIEQGELLPNPAFLESSSAKLVFFPTSINESLFDEIDGIFHRLQLDALAFVRSEACVWSLSQDFIGCLYSFVIENVTEDIVVSSLDGSVILGISSFEFSFLMYSNDMVGRWLSPYLGWYREAISDYSSEWKKREQCKIAMYAEHLVN